MEAKEPSPGKPFVPSTEYTGVNRSVILGNIFGS